MEDVRLMDGQDEGWIAKWKSTGCVMDGGVEVLKGVGQVAECRTI
jgi:hypothetical protein